MERSRLRTSGGVGHNSRIVVLPAELGPQFASVIKRWGGTWAARVEEFLARSFPHLEPDERQASIWAHTVLCPSTRRARRRRQPPGAAGRRGPRPGPGGDTRLEKRGLLGGPEVSFDRVTDQWLLAWSDVGGAELPSDEALKLSIATHLDLDDLARPHKVVRASSGTVTLLSR